MNSSPSPRNTGGFRPPPTPAGVPVMMTVPLGKVVPDETKLTISATEKIRSLWGGKISIMTLTSDGDTWARADKGEEKGVRKQQ